MVCIMCMVGNDYQRILDGVQYWDRKEGIENIYLLYDDKKDKYGFVSQANALELVKTFSPLYGKPTTLGYNPQDFTNVFCALHLILCREVEQRRRQVMIDATSTTKEAYGATVTVSLMFKGVRIYIIPPKERGWYVPSPQDPDFQEWFEKTRSVPGLDPVEIYLPGERFEKPKPNATIILTTLKKHGGSANTLVSLMRRCGYDPDDPVAKNRFSRIVARLDKGGFVKKIPTKQGKRVSLTRFGEVYAEAIDNQLPPKSVPRA